MRKKQQAAAKPLELNKERVMDIYQKMLTELTTEVDEAINKAKQLVANGAPSELLIASLTEQYPMMAVYAENVALKNNGLTQEQLLKAVEKFEKDPELEALLNQITSLSEKFNALKDDSIEPVPLPDHLTKELCLEVAQHNADITLKTIRETAAKQKATNMPDEEAAELAEKEAQAAQKATFEKHNITQEQMTAALLKFSTSDEEFGNKMQEISANLSMEMHKLRAAELGITPEQLAMRQEIQQAVEMLAAQGLSPDEISKVLAQSLNLNDDGTPADASSSSSDAADKDKKKKKKKKIIKKKKAASSDAASSASAAVDEEQGDDDADDASAASVEDVE